MSYRGGCVKGMPYAREDQPSCRRTCLHRALVQDFRDSRHAWEERRENGEAMQMEDAEYRAVFPPPTFKEWLIRSAGRTGAFPESVPA